METHNSVQIAAAGRDAALEPDSNAIERARSVPVRQGLSCQRPEAFPPSLDLAD